MKIAEFVGLPEKNPPRRIVNALHRNSRGNADYELESPLVEISDDSDPPTEQRRRNGSEMHELWRNGSAGLKKESARFFFVFPVAALLECDQEKVKKRRKRRLRAHD